MTQLTELLGRMQAGDPQARDALFASAYNELHRLAHARLRDGGRNTVLDTTCLVHESYLRFVRAGELRAEDRRAFFAYASQVMRSVIVNSVRERIAQKRGGDRPPLTLSNGLGAALPDAEVTMQDLAGDNDHWGARVVSSAFKGLSRVKQHQIVYAALRGRMGGELHALALQTSAPE